MKRQHHNDVKHFSIEIPGTMETLGGMQDCLPKTERGKARADFGINQKARAQKLKGEPTNQRAHDGR